jgi:predicted DNA-binding protein
VNPRVAMVMRAFRVPLDLWERAETISKVRNETMSEVIRAALVAYVKRYGKDLGVPGE